MMHGNSLNILLITIIVPSPNSRCPLPDVDSKLEWRIQDVVCAASGQLNSECLKNKTVGKVCQVFS